jgi:asparagine synthase (glutamine-hydrolysing)
VCGIAGFLDPESILTKESLQLMTDSIKHRGPDAEGIYYEQQNGIGLGHRRLSILDVSTSSNQPFYSKDKTHIIVFNGEVYNYRELAKKYNLTLSTTSDTEVIIELYIKLGKKCVGEFNGMFAFAIYNIITNELFLCRDRLGVKPLFIYKEGAMLVFASELKALQINKKIKEKLTINKDAVRLFLHLGYIPEPYTIYNEIQKFPSGSYSTIGKYSQLEEKYWTPEAKISEKVLSDYASAKAELNNLLERSIRYRMISDVPLGTFLSGGIDSSLVTAIAQKNSDKPINTFSIGFKEARYNEAVHASKIAKFLKTNHHEFILSEQEAMESLERIIDHFDEPFADTSALPTWMVSKLASKEVKVILTGDGGDELFMGYGSYNWAQRLDKMNSPLVRNFFRLALNASGQDRYKRIANLFDYKNTASVKSHIFSQEQGFFSEKQLDEILIGFEINEAWENIGQTARKLSPKEYQTLFDMKYYLRDDLLVKVDRASMYASIEAREPLLDYKLIEFSLNLGENLKYKNGISKLLLKEVLYDYIPNSYFERPKWGFSIPLAQWMKKDMEYLITNYLSAEVTEGIGIVRYDAIKILKERFYKGENYLYNRLWAIIVLHKWFIKNT